VAGGADHQVAQGKGKPHRAGEDTLAPVAADPYPTVSPRSLEPVRDAGRRLLWPLLGTRTWARAFAAATHGRLPVPEVVARLSAIARQWELPPLLVVGVALAETGLRGRDEEGNLGRGWFQMYVHKPPYPTSERPPTLEEAHDLDYSAGEFCRAATRRAEYDASLRRDLWRWAVETQGVAGFLDTNVPYRPAAFATLLREADGLIRAFAAR
jgi:hypothetical protein